MFSLSIKACEKNFDDMFEMRDKKNKTLLLAHDDTEEDLSCLDRCVSSCFSWFFSIKSFASSEKNIDETNPLLTRVNTKPLKKINLPHYIILTIASFLNHPDQLKLSHVNKQFRASINEDFWRRQIIRQRYLLWDNSVPKAKGFFANYFYQKGFGRNPNLSEKIVDRIEDITCLPNVKLAAKALALGFPKGKENYSQTEHKKFMLKKESSLNSVSTLDFYRNSKLLS